ncbi:hypothetical protein [Streptomyces sp. DH37]|uniref:hypothetical protein n=1 Tax=Streptomyces sp. DH37 TaxID=3040122 RepID=UPI002440ED1E|nr:hypothetical protein [Streptomyces sp. DH37]MDG9702957.1 hypothetical protein [Streptomyces sp. DH37]
MPVSALALAALEQLVESRLGLAGVFGLIMLTIGYRERNATYGCIGALVLTLLVLPAA